MLLRSERSCVRVRTTSPGTSLLLDDVPDHVLHPVAVGLQLLTHPCCRNSSSLYVRAAAGGVGGQVLQDAERDLVDAIVGEIALQAVDAGDLGLVGQRGCESSALLSCDGRRRRTLRTARPTDRSSGGTACRPGWLRCCSSRWRSVRLRRVVLQGRDVRRRIVRRLGDDLAGQPCAALHRVRLAAVGQAGQDRRPA